MWCSIIVENQYEILGKTDKTDKTRQELDPLRWRTSRHLDIFVSSAVEYMICVDFEYLTKNWRSYANEYKSSVEQKWNVILMLYSSVVEIYLEIIGGTNGTNGTNPRPEIVKVLP
jgi:hypothetical protein